MSYFLFAPLEPLFGLQHAIDAARQYWHGIPADPTTLDAAAAAIPNEVAALKWITVCWLGGHVWFFVAAIAAARRDGDREAGSFAVLLLAAFATFYGFNFFYNDAPNERYDHFVVLLPLVLYAAASLTRSLRRGDRFFFLTRLRAEHVIVFFLAVGFLRFAVAPRGASFLFQLRSGYPGHFSEYYFSLGELGGTSEAELAFLAGYRPLRVLNLDGRPTGLFSPHYYLDKRSLDAVARHLSQGGADSYQSPDVRNHFQTQAKGGGG